MHEGRPFTSSLVRPKEPVMVQSGRISFGVCRLFPQMLIHCCCFAVMTCLAFGADANLAPERDQQVANHLAAGEFGPAMKLAANAPTPDERAAVAAENRRRTTRVRATPKRRWRHAVASPANEKVAKRQAPGQAQVDDPALGGGAQQNLMMLVQLIQRVFQDAGWEDREKVSISAWPPMNNTGGGVKVAPGGLLHRLTNRGQCRPVGCDAAACKEGRSQ